jgi:hypothetical protein
MKKLLFFLNILLVGIIVFMACNSNQTATATPQLYDSCLVKLCQSFPGEELKGKIEGILLKNMSDSFAADPGKGFITGSILNEPIDPHNLARVATGGQVNDALSTVFDLKKLKRLIYEMQKNACDNKCDPKIELGIRFYYIKYPANAGDLNGPPSLLGLPATIKNKHGLVMVPVYKKPNGDWYDYDLWGRSTGCFNRIDSISTGNSEFPLFFGVASDAGDNHGGVGPPPDPGTFPTNEIDQ